MNEQKGEYSVVQFFKDGNYEYVRRFVSVEEAFSAFKHYTSSIAVKLGMVERVIITDGGDCTNVEWLKGKGIVFPTKEMIEQEAKNKGDSNACN